MTRRRVAWALIVVGLLFVAGVVGNGVFFVLEFDVPLSGLLLGALPTLGIPVLGYAALRWPTRPARVALALGALLLSWSYVALWFGFLRGPYDAAIPWTSYAVGVLGSALAAVGLLAAVRRSRATLWAFAGVAAALGLLGLWRGVQGVSAMVPPWGADLRFATGMALNLVLATLPWALIVLAFTPASSRATRPSAS